MNFSKFSFRAISFSRAFASDRFSEVRASFSRHLAKWRAGNLSWRKFTTNPTKFYIRAEQISAWLCWMLILVIAGCATYWIMRIAQIPFPSAVSSKGLVFYEAASSQSVRALFGEKSFDPSRLVLRGVVITGNDAGANQGIALIEVDGKPAEAIAIGEMVPPGVRLEKIQPDGVKVSYQGREINLQP